MKGPEIKQILNGEVDMADVEEIESPVSESFYIRKAELLSQGSTLKAYGVYRDDSFE